MSSSSQQPKRKRILKTAIKFALVGLLFYFLAQKGFISLDETRKAFTRLEYIVPAFGVLLMTTVFSIVRWQWLLRAQGIHLPWARTIQLVFIGTFFNLALPGAVSGDFIKAFYIAKEVEGQGARAFGSILFDRVAGLSALVLVSAGALAMNFNAFVNTKLFAAIKFFILFAALGVIAFYSFLFLVREQRDPLLKFLKVLETKHKLGGSFKRIYEGLRHYHAWRGTVLRVVLISVLTHILVGFAFLNFAHAFGDMDIPNLAVYVVVPLGLLVTAIPIMPAGVGTGHLAFGSLFLLLGSQRGADVFSLFVLSNLAMGAIGGLVYLRFRTHEPAVVMANS